MNVLSLGMHIADVEFPVNLVLLNVISMTLLENSPFHYKRIKHFLNLHSTTRQYNASEYNHCKHARKGMSSSDSFPIHSKFVSQTVLVTGGTAGIGYEVARAFAESHARVLLLSRKVENGDRAAAEIKNTVSDKVDVHFVECDLGNLKHVKDVGDKIREEEERLDIVCHVQNCHCHAC